jgi:prevent-host-death family protein
MTVTMLESSYDEGMDVVSSEVGVRELKARLSAYLAAVQQGKEVIVTDRGRPVARLVPVERDVDEHRARLIAEGRLIPPRSKVRALPEPRYRLSEGSIVDFLRDQRR